MIALGLTGRERFILQLKAEQSIDHGAGSGYDRF